jgi:thiamine pyrophosphate-dependent acetolactate synthase large subunit-like protein
VVAIRFAWFFTVPCGMLAQAPDLVLLVGARRGISLGGRTESSIPASATVVHVDIDGVEPDDHR